MWLLLQPFAVLNSGEGKKADSIQSQFVEKMLRVAGFELRECNDSAISSGCKRAEL
jgi:hypothetical protein